MRTLGSTVVVDYGVGNVHSVANMLLHLGYPSTISAAPEVIARAERLFLPGVGAWDAALGAIEATGLDSALRTAIVHRAVPTLGLCLGMQLLFETSEEGELPGLGILPGRVTRLAEHPGARIPHMGWNDVTPTQAHPLWDTQDTTPRFADLDALSKFYFVHSFRAQCAEALVLGTAHHGAPFTCVVGRDNVVGAQFHPEKSHRYGMRFLSNFMEFRP